MATRKAYKTCTLQVVVECTFVDKVSLWVATDSISICATAIFALQARAFGP